MNIPSTTWRIASNLPAMALAASLCAGSAAQAADTLDKIRDSGAIVLANRKASMPFSYLDEHGKPIGYTIDICLKLTEAIKRELKLPQLEIRYLTVSPSDRIAAVTDGKADLECGTTTNNAERRKQVAFTVPHFVYGIRMLVRSDSGIRNWPDLRGRRVVTTHDTTTVGLLAERNKVRALNMTLLEGQDHDDSFSQVQRRTADAFAMDDVLLYGLRAGAANPADFAIVGDALSIETYAIMLRKGDPAFKAVIDREMTRLITNGELARLYGKWFDGPVPPKGLNLKMPMSYLMRDLMRFPGGASDD